MNYEIRRQLEKNAHADPSWAAACIMELEAEVASLKRVVQTEYDKREALDAEVARLQDEIADYDNAMLRKFDPQAAESTDLSTWISCNLAEIERLRETIASNWGDPNDPKLLSALTGKEE